MYATNEWRQFSRMSGVEAALYLTFRLDEIWLL